MADSDTMKEIAIHLGNIAHHTEQANGMFPISSEVASISRSIQELTGEVYGLNKSLKQVVEAINLISKHN